MNRFQVFNSPSPVIRALATLVILAVGCALVIRVWQLDSRLKRLEQSLDDMRAAADRGGHGNLPMSARVDFNGTAFDTIEVDITKTAVRLYFKDKNGDRLGSLQRLKDYIQSDSGNLAFATNAGMYTMEGNPLGLFIENRKQISPINLRDGKDNFYLKPNGVFALTKGKALVVDSSQFQSQLKALADTDPILFATQSGPLLVVDAKIHPAFQPNSINRVVRSGVGLVSPTRIVFAISDEPVNFYEFASLFRDRFKCNNALFLDGVVSRMYLPALKRYDGGGDFAGIIGIAK
ncbi:MAG: phosphodiester glycosidase family protein [Blastocatellia bacterium]